MSSQSVSQPEWKKRSDMKVLNTDLRRVDGEAKVTGAAVYSHDVRLPNMLYAKFLRCPHPAAKITKLDLGPVASVPGAIHALEVESEETRFLGQPVAAVAAETLEAAEDAIRAIRVEYETSGWAVTEEQGLDPKTPNIGRRGNSFVDRETGDLEEAKAALEGADVVVTSTYRVPVQHHCSLETHGMVVDFDGKRAKVWASTQHVTGVSQQVAGELKIPTSDVEVITDYMGGGFGAKFGIGIEGQTACRFAKELKRPIHLMLDRTDEFLFSGNRSGGRQILKAGATLDGRMVGLTAEVWRHGGLARGSNPGQPYIYSVESSHMAMGSVHTNTDANRAMRAPGHPQASFAIEGIVDELAYAIGMDTLDFRMRNLTDPVYHRQLDRVAREIGWYEHTHRAEPNTARGGKNVGIGFGISVWGGGGYRVCVTSVRIDPDGSVTASCGSQDLGTGTRTYVGAIAAEEFGLKAAQVVGRVGHSEYGPANGSGGSTTVASLAPAVKDAAHKARELFAERLASWLECEPAQVRFEGGTVFSTADTSRKLDWTEACSILGSSPIEASGEFRGHLQTEGVHGAQAAMVEVDTETGALKVLKMVGIQDCGLPLNRIGIRSQINGGMIEALGYALFEERIIEPWLGHALSANFNDYKLPGCKEMPELVAIIDDDDDRQQVIGMAEPTIIPGHSAIANAVHNACGVRIYDLPLTPDKLLMGLIKKA